MTENTIREFLALPPEALPSARWVDDSDADMGSAWAYLWDSLRREELQRMNHMGMAIVLTAHVLTSHQDGWRGGVVVSV